MNNLYNDVPARPAGEPAQELFTTLCENGETRIERIVSRGHRSPDGFWYDQPQDEFVVLLKGSAVLEFADDSEPLHLHPGDWVLIRAHQRHRVSETRADHDTVWLAVHLPTSSGELPSPVDNTRSVSRIMGSAPP